MVWAIGLAIDGGKKRHFHYELDYVDDSYCSDRSDLDSIKKCKRANEVASLIKWYARLNGDDWSDLESWEEILEEYFAINPNDDIYYRIADYTLDWAWDIKTLAEDVGLGIYKTDYSKSVLWTIIAIISYIILTDILRWACYYIVSWNYELYLFSKLKSLVKKS